MDVSTSLGDVATVLQLSDSLWSAAKWGRTKRGSQLRSMVERAVERACRSAGLFSAELEPTTKKVQDLVWAHIRAHGLSPAFILGLADERAWEAGLRGGLENVLGESEVQTVLAVLRSELLQGVQSMLPKTTAVDIADRIHAAEGSETLATVREVLRHAERLEEVAAAIQGLERSLGTLGARTQASGPKRAAARLRPPMLNHKIHGREPEITALIAALRGSSDSPLVAFVRGVSGVGKTAVAVAVWGRVADEYSDIWWVDGSSATAFASDLCTVAACLDLPDPFADPRVTIGRLRSALESRATRFLIVVDDLDPYTDADPLLPLSWGHVVVTTQRSGVENLEPDVDVPLSGIDEAAAAALVNELATDADPVSLPPNLSRFADGTFLPASLREAVIGWRASRVSGHEPSALSRFSVSVSRIRTVSAPSARLLELLALAPAAPLDLGALMRAQGLSTYLGLPGTSQPSVSAARLLAPLQECLIVEPGDVDCVRLHDVLRESILASINQADATRGWAALGNALLETLPTLPSAADRETFLPWLDTIDHLIASADLYCSGSDLTLGRLALRGGLIHNALAERTIGFRQLSIAKGHLSRQDSDEIIRCEIEMARCERHFGLLDAALARLAHVARSNRGVTMAARSDALILASRLLTDMNAASFGALVARGAVRLTRGSGYSVSMAYSMLGRAQLSLGQPRAIRAFETARDLMAREHSAEDPINAWSLDDLAAATSVQGNRLEAHQLFTDALGAETELTGVDHPRRAWTLVNLALVAASIDKSSPSALALLEEGMDLQRRAVPAANPDLQRFESAARRLGSNSAMPLQATPTAWSGRVSWSILRGLVRM